MATRILKLGSQNPVGILVLGESGRYPDGNQNPITTRFRKPSGISKAVESTANPNEVQNPG
jgi:hypothetical protein